MLAAFLLLLSLLPAGVRAAAPPDEETRPSAEEVERRRKAQEEAERAASEARKRQVASREKDVAYEEVLADPDNVDLNFRYALTLVRRGNLRGAAATLERVLMVRNDFHKARLFYAVVLFRLDNLDDSERELAVLKAQPIPADLRAELDQYTREIRKRRRRTSGSAQVGAGFDFDENRNAAPATGIRFVNNARTIVNRDGSRRNDTAKTMLASLNLARDLGFQQGHRAFASLTYFRAEQTHLRHLNIQNHGARAGLALNFRWLKLTPSYDFNHLRLSQATYLRSHEAKLEIEKPAKRHTLKGDVSFARLDHSNTQIVIAGQERSGERLSGGAVVEVVVTPGVRMDLGYHHARTETARRFNSFNRDSFTLGHSWLLGKGQFLLSGLTYQLDGYDLPEPAVHFSRRRDETLRLRSSYGLPLTVLARFLKGSLLTLTYEYFHSSSNLPNYAYSNNKLSSLFTYRFDF